MFVLLLVVVFCFVLLCFFWGGGGIFIFYFSISSHHHQQGKSAMSPVGTSRKVWGHHSAGSGLAMVPCGESWGATALRLECMAGAVGRRVL